MDKYKVDTWAGGRFTAGSQFIIEAESEGEAREKAMKLFKNDMESYVEIDCVQDSGATTELVEGHTL